MSFYPRLAALWRNLTQRARVERDLDDELRAALDLLVAEKVRRGMPPEDARRAAALELGGLDVVKEQVRDARTGAGLESLLQDHVGLPAQPRRSRSRWSGAGFTSKPCRATYMYRTFLSGIPMQDFPVESPSLTPTNTNPVCWCG